MYEHLQRALLSIGFLHPQNPEHIMFALRRLFGRAGLEDAEVRILLGLARQMEWAAGQRAAQGVTDDRSPMTGKEKVGARPDRAQAGSAEPSAHRSPVTAHRSRLSSHG
jgi:hypothetical protein